MIRKLIKLSLALELGIPASSVQHVKEVGKISLEGLSKEQEMPVSLKESLAKATKWLNDEDFYLSLFALGENKNRFQKYDIPSSSFQKHKSKH